jgi:hypothetical protein
MTWEMACTKFERLAEPYTTAAERRVIADAVFNLESTSASDLGRLLGSIHVPRESGEVIHD